MQKPLHEVLIGKWHELHHHSISAYEADTEFFADNTFTSRGAIVFRSPDGTGGTDILCEKFTIEGRWEVNGTKLTERVDTVRLSGLFIYPDTPIDEADLTEERRATLKAQGDLIELALNTVETADIVKVEADRIVLYDVKDGSRTVITRAPKAMRIPFEVDLSGEPS